MKLSVIVNGCYLTITEGGHFVWEGAWYAPLFRQDGVNLIKVYLN